MIQSPVLRIVLAAFVLLFAGMMVSDWGAEPPSRRWAIGIFVGLMVLFAIALLAPRRMRWAFRLLAGCIFLLYAGYFVDQARRLLSGTPQRFALGRPSTVMAGIGLLVFGIPCLVYALSGQWIPVYRTLRRGDDATRKPDDDGPR